MATLILFFSYSWQLKVFHFRSQIEFNQSLSFLELNNLIVTYNSIKEESNIHILYFGCLATNFLDFDINTLLCVAMVTILAMYILQQVWLCTADYN